MRRLIARLLPAAFVAALVAACGTGTGAAPTTAQASAPASRQSGSPGAGTAGWTTLAPADEGFALQMPGSPTKQTTTYDTTIGPAPASVWAFGRGESSGFYASHVSYPAGSLSAGATKSILDGALQGGLATQAGASITDQADVTLDGRPGRTFTVTVTDGRIRGAVYLSADQMYMLYAVYNPLDAAAAADVDKFLASFRFTA